MLQTQGSQRLHPECSCAIKLHMPFHRITGEGVSPRKEEYLWPYVLNWHTCEYVIWLSFVITWHAAAFQESCGTFASWQSWKPAICWEFWLDWAWTHAPVFLNLYGLSAPLRLVTDIPPLLQLQTPAGTRRSLPPRRRTSKLRKHDNFKLRSSAAFVDWNFMKFLQIKCVKWLQINVWNPWGALCLEVVDMFLNVSRQGKLRCPTYGHLLTCHQEMVRQLKQRCQSLEAQLSKRHGSFGYKRQRPRMTATGWDNVAETWQQFTEVVVIRC